MPSWRSRARKVRSPSMSCTCCQRPPNGALPAARAAITMLVPVLAAIVYPYRKRHLWEQGAGHVRATVAGIPVSMSADVDLRPGGKGTLLTYTGTLTMGVRR